MVVPLLALVPLPALEQARAEGNPATGRRIAGEWCGACHQVAPYDPERAQAPPFMKIGREAWYSRAYIRDWVAHPHSAMPRVDLTEEMLDHLVSYLRTFRPPAPPSDSLLATRLRLRYATGSAFYVTGAGHLVTAAHLVEKCDAITIKQPGGKARPARHLGRSPALDVAILKTGAAPSGAATFAPGATIEVGDSVVAYGYPTDVRDAFLSLVGMVGAGHISALSGAGNDPARFRATFHTRRGMDGAPVLDDRARLVGMTLSRPGAGLAAHVAASLPPGASDVVKSTSIQLFLAEKGIFPELRAGGTMLVPDQIARRARAFTARVDCWFEGSRARGN